MVEHFPIVYQNKKIMISDEDNVSVLTEAGDGINDCYVVADCASTNASGVVVRRKHYFHQKTYASRHKVVINLAYKNVDINIFVKNNLDKVLGKIPNHLGADNIRRNTTNAVHAYRIAYELFNGI